MFFIRCLFDVIDADLRIGVDAGDLVVSSFCSLADDDNDGIILLIRIVLTLTINI